MNLKLRITLLSVLEKTNLDRLKRICSHCVIDDLDKCQEIRRMQRSDYTADALVLHFSSSPRSLEELVECIRATDPEVAELIEKQSQALNHTSVSSNEEARTPTTEDNLQQKLESQDWYAARLPENIKRISKEEASRLRDEIAIVLITATDIELKQLMAKLKSYSGKEDDQENNILETTDERGNSFFLGMFGSVKAAVTLCEIGENALNFLEILKTWRPKAVFMVGTAFGMKPEDQKRGDIILVSRIINYSNAQEQFSTTEALQKALRISGIKSNFFTSPDGYPCRVYKNRPETILSGKEKISDLKRIKELSKKYPEAAGGEMEGAELGLAA